MSKIPVVMIEGDGIGPEISAAVKDIFAASQAPIEWVAAEAGLHCIEKTGNGCPAETLERVREVGIALKGPTTTPIGGGHKSVNVTIRKALDLYANVRPSRTIPGVETKFRGIDLIIVRENIEDTYGGIEHQQTPEVAQCLRLITKPGCRKIARYAFEMARAQGRRHVVCVHKANIMKMTDGLFLETFRGIAAEYPDVQASDMLVDNACMQLVARPEKFDVLLLPNLFGDIVSDLCAGLVGGLGVAPGGNIGDNCAVFEAVHGSAPDIAGKGVANPTALLLSSLSMLRHLRLLEHADAIERALIATLESGARTRDLGGSLNTAEFTAAIVKNLTPPVSAAAPVAPKAAIKAEPAPARTAPVDRKVTGFDIFIQCDGIPALPEKVGPFALKMMSNRGQKVWPGKAPEILLVDCFRCRYLADSAVSDGDVDSAVSELGRGWIWMHVEKLLEFDGKVGYSAAQGQ